MITRIVIFLIRIKLGLKKYEDFQFVNQKSNYDKYYFGNVNLYKMEYDKNGRFVNLRPANVSLNWILNDDCEIKKV